MLLASFKGMESRQLNCQVNDDQFGASGIQIHPAIPEIEQLLYDHVNVPEMMNCNTFSIKKDQKFFHVQVLFQVTDLSFYAADFARDKNLSACNLTTNFLVNILIYSEKSEKKENVAIIRYVLLELL